MFFVTCMKYQLQVERKNWKINETFKGTQQRSFLVYLLLLNERKPIFLSTVRKQFIIWRSPAFEQQNTRLLIVFMETVRMVKSKLRKNQSERSD